MVLQKKQRVTAYRYCGKLIPGVARVPLSSKAPRRRRLAGCCAGQEKEEERGHEHSQKDKTPGATSRLVGA